MNWVRCTMCRTLGDVERFPRCMMCGTALPSARPAVAIAPPQVEKQVQSDQAFGAAILISIGVLLVSSFVVGRMGGPGAHTDEGTFFLALFGLLGGIVIASVLAAVYVARRTARRVEASRTPGGRVDGRVWAVLAGLAAAVFGFVGIFILVFLTCMAGATV